MPREPLAGGKGKRTPAEYTVELTPKQRLDRSVGVFRERPLPRGSVLALHEAVFREGTANQRWYREEVRPLSLPGRRIFLFCSAKIILNRRDYYADL